MKTILFLVTAAAAAAQQSSGRIDGWQFYKFDQNLALHHPAKSAPSARWWANPAMAQRLNLTADQLRKMDDIFQQNRIQLIDLNAALEKAEAILEPLVAADQPDDNKVLAQIDRIAQARADLEKANSRMLWAIRRTLTPEQWKALQEPSLKPKPQK